MSVPTPPSVLLPMVFSSTDGRYDTVIVVQNRADEERPAQLRVFANGQTVWSSTESVMPRGLSTHLASEVMQSGLGCASLGSQELNDLNISAFLIDFNSMKLSQMDILPEATQAVDLHVYYSDMGGAWICYLVLSNLSNDAETAHIQTTGFDSLGVELGAFNTDVSANDTKIIDLRNHFSPGLGWIRVESDKPGLTAAGIMDFSYGSSIELMRAFPR